jgi:hypothetical protein
MGLPAFPTARGMHFGFEAGYVADRGYAGEVMSGGNRSSSGFIMGHFVLILP